MILALILPPATAVARRAAAVVAAAAALAAFSTVAKALEPAGPWPQAPASLAAPWGGALQLHHPEALGLSHRGAQGAFVIDQPAAVVAQARSPRQLVPKPARVSPAAAPEWASEDAIIAQARCAALLQDVTATYTKVDAFKEGECGAVAPLEVHTIGASPSVALSPPAVMTCDLLAAVHKWLHQDLQPLSRKLMGAPLVKIEVMSAYSCRNAYGRAKARLSEHGRANALDIRGFTTASGQTADLLADWGPTRRQIIAAAAARKAAEARTKAVAQRTPPGPGTVQPGAMPPEPATARIAAGAPQPAAGAAPALSSAASSSATGDDPTLGLRTSLANADETTAGGDATTSALPVTNRLMFFAPPSRLGGPKPGAAMARAALPVNGEQLFLRKAHETACSIFSTVLGPEANNAHRNHFHVDMAERASGPFCQ